MTVMIQTERPQPEEPTVGSEIRLARKTAGLSQSELGERIGVSHGTISNWENGNGYPNVIEMVRIIEATGAVWLADLTRCPSAWMATIPGHNW